MSNGIQIRKKQIVIIITALVVLLATGLTCAIVFWPREKKLTTQEWLDAFSESLDYATMTKDEDGNALETYIAREIEIKEIEDVVVKFKQTLQIAIAEDGQATAYLAIEENYPTLEESKDDLMDEYYLCQGKMYTRREKGGKVQSSSFDSNLDILLTVASENLGNAQYNFEEDNFLPVENGKGIITHDGNTHQINAMISQDKYNKFFGKDANIDGMSEVKIQMQMTDRRFDWLQIQYKQGDLSSMIKITRYDIQPVATPEWAK